MENSVSENDMKQTIRSPPRRRRSTFFERRDSLVPQLLLERIEPSVSKTNTENQELQRYYDKLLLEKDQWKKEVNNRKNRYYDLRAQYQLAVKAPSKSRISYSTLTNEDIEFLQGKVNLTKLIESQKQLHKSIEEAHTLFIKASELDDVILSHCENKVKKITDYILDNSNIEPDA